MSVSKPFTPVTQPENIHQLIFQAVQQLSAVYYGTSAPEQKEVIYKLIKELNDRSLSLLEQEIDTNSQDLVDATDLIKSSTATAKQAIGDIDKTTKLIGQVAQAIQIIDQVLKIAGPFVV